MKHKVDVDVATASGSIDVSGAIERMTFERTVLLKSCPFMIKIDNSDGTYDDKFAKFDEIEIKVEKTPGSASYKTMFGGRIFLTQGIKSPGKKRTIILQGLDYFHDLQGLLVSGIWISKAAGTIISGWLEEHAPHLDRTNIDTGPTLDYYGCQDKPLSEGISEVVDQPECVGWYFWLVGKYAYFKDLSETVATLQLTGSAIRNYDVKRDSFEYANRQKVYGAAKPLHPDDGDSYTENDAGNWVGSNITLSNEMEKIKRGDYSIKATHTTGQNRYFRRSFSEALNLNVLEHLYFWFMQDTTLVVQIRLMTDAANYYYHDYTPGESDQWFEKAYRVGADAEGWTPNAAPNWSNITMIEFYYPNTDTTTTLTIIDYLRFVGTPVIKVAEDWASQEEVGFVKEAPPIVDASIRDPEFAENLAQAALASYGVERVEITIPQRYSAIDLDKFNEGEQVLVQISDEDINNLYVLWTTKYEFTRLGLTVDYQLGSRPSDFITQLKFLRLDLERAKQAQIDPARNYDIWNRFYVPLPLDLTTVLNDIGISKFDLDAKLGKPPLTFPFTFPGEFGGIWPTLQITED